MRSSACIAPIAEQQLGLVARHQLLDEGMSASTLDSILASGRLVPIERAVYRVPGAPETPWTRLLAKVLACGPGSMISHRSAAWLWELCDAPVRHEISVPRDRRLRRPDLVVHESTDLQLANPGTVHGVPVTGVGRTILDCAGDPGVDVELLIDAARRVHRISRTLLPHVAVTHARSGRRGINRLRSLLELDDLPHSDFERLVWRWLDDQGVTGWVRHHHLVLPGYGAVEVDVAWPDLCIALELEGGDHIDRSAVHDNDTWRQNRLVLGRWLIVRCTYRRWLREADAVLDEITGAIAVRSAERR
ncbi:MAG TPA: hypothetical protein VFV42_05250 [Acidimicrobiales bacterium]|nr:hypothetical protein [Acidimicrobiales bacterium]